MLINFIAPKEKKEWHGLWEKCHNSWKAVFKHHDIKLWNDREDLDRLVKTNYSKYYDVYKTFPAHIMKIDFARLCILHSYGGIYADMDIFCYNNFLDALNSEYNEYILEAPYGDVPIENALMISLSKDSKFFELCINESIESYSKLPQTITYPWDNSTNRELILNTAGPKLIYNTIIKYGVNRIGFLDGRLFNNHGMSYDPAFYTKHILTGVWGKDAVTHLKKQFKQNNEQCKTFREFRNYIYMKDVRQYAKMSDVTVNTFDFYTDYTNGRYLK